MDSHYLLSGITCFQLEELPLVFFVQSRRSRVEVEGGIKAGEK